MQVVTAEDMPPFIHIVHKPSKTALLVHATAMGAAQVDLASCDLIGQIKGALDAASWVAKTQSDPYVNDGDRIVFVNKKSGLTLRCDPGGILRVELSPNASWDKDGNSQGVTPADKTKTRTQTAGTWIVQGEDLQNLSFQMNYLEEVLSKDSGERKKSQTDRPYLGQGDISVGGMNAETTMFSAKAAKGPNTDWHIMVSGALYPNNTDAKAADDADPGGFAVITKLASDLLKLAGDIAKIASGDGTATTFYTAAFITRAIAGVSELAKFFRDADKDMIEQIEKAILPAVETIVTREIQESEIRDIQGSVQTAIDELSTAVKILERAGIDPDDNTPLTAAEVGRRVGANGLQSVDDCLRAASNALANARGATEIADDRIPLWTAVAKMILAVELLRLFCFQDKYEQESLARMNLVYEHGKARLESEVAARRKRVVNHADAALPAPNAIVLPSDGYMAHLALCVDRSLGTPSQVLRGFSDAIFACTGAPPEAGPLAI